MAAFTACYYRFCFFDLMAISLGDQILIFRLLMRRVAYNLNSSYTNYMENSKPDIRLFHLIHQAHRALFRAADRYLQAEFGISSSQHAVMAFLKANPNASLKDITHAVGLKKAAASALIDRMAKRGFVVRQQGATDRRYFEHRITEAGLNILQSVSPSIKSTNDALLGMFSDEEQEFLADALKRIKIGVSDIEALHQTNTERKLKETV